MHVLATLLVLVVSLWEQAGEMAQMSALAFFLLVYLLNGHASGDWSRYLRHNWLDLFLIALLSTPLLRLFLLLNLASVLPAVRVGALLHLNRKRLLGLLVLSQESLPVTLALIFALVLIFGACTYAFEHGHNPAFATLDNAFWWAIVTLTTVGYGDIVPVTTGGRIVAALNMIFGILVYSLAIANFSRLIEQQSQEQKRLLLSMEEKPSPKDENSHSSDTGASTKNLR